MSETVNIEEIKIKLEEYFLDMHKYYKQLFIQEAKIKQSKSLEYLPITQNGFIYFESKDITHFIVPLNILDRSHEPPEYIHKVMVYNIKTNLFDTVYNGLQHKCIEYVYRYQEKKYGFSLKDKTEANIWLTKCKEYFDWTGELLEEDYNKQSQDRIIAIINDVKKELGIIDEDQLPQVDIELLRQQSLERNRIKEERRKAIDNDKFYS